MAKTRPELTAELLTVARVSDVARSLWRSGIADEAFLDTLEEHCLLEDALRLQPYVLSAREAVWWGCVCVWHVSREASTEADREALAAAARWVIDPSAENQQAARGEGPASNFETAATCLSAAAWWSGPTPVAAAPAAHFAARLVAAAVFMAAMTDTLKFVDHYRYFLGVARKIMQGVERWPAPPTPQARPNPDVPASRYESEPKTVHA